MNCFLLQIFRYLIMEYVFFDFNTYTKYQLCINHFVLLKSTKLGGGNAEAVPARFHGSFVTKNKIVYRIV